MRLISSRRMTSADASGPNSVMNAPVAGLIIWKPDDFGGLQVGAPLDARELRVADRRDDDAEERLADARHAPQQQVAGVHLALLVLVVRRRNLRHQHDVGERLFPLVSNERLAGFGDDALRETRWLLSAQDARYWSSETGSSHSVVSVRLTAKCAILVSGPAPCQCFSLGSMQTASPAAMARTGSPHFCTRPRPSFTSSSCGALWRCQLVRPPGSNSTR